MNLNHYETLAEGLWDRLARHARSSASARRFLVEQLTHLISNDPRIA